MTYEDLKAKVQRLQSEGKLPKTPTREQRIDFAYGNAVLSNPEVTVEMAERAVDDSLVESAYPDLVLPETPP